jgi:hypothetical protein
VETLDKANAPSAEPALGGITHNDTASNEQAVPVPWWIGPAPLPLTWIIPEPYNIDTVEVQAKVGKKNTTVGYKYYADVAGIAGLGLGKRLRWLESDGEIIWQGSLVRSDDPASPDYYGVEVFTSVGTWYVTWGRWDQPEDTVLLAPLAQINPALAHPAYRGQVRVVIKRYYCGESGSQVPNTRIGMEREPVPPIGDFAAPSAGVASSQGQSIIAGLLELAMHPVYGAGLSEDHFAAADWESGALDVLAACGGHAPLLDRAQPLRDVAKDFSSYYDGFFRIENGRLRPGRFPHAAAMPDGLPLLTLHDYMERPAVRATAVAAVVNTVNVKYRERANNFADTIATGHASDAVQAIDAHEPAEIAMPAIIDPVQAQQIANEQADIAADGKITAEGAVLRTARAVKGDGTPLLPGDQVVTRLIAFESEIPARVTRRVDHYQGAPELDFENERGAWPASAAGAADERPAIEPALPRPVEAARVLELPAGLAPSPLGIHVALLARRPLAASASGMITAANITGMSVWYSPAGDSYDWLGSTHSFAVRGVLFAALPDSSAPSDVTLVLDDANLDAGRITPQGAAAQDNDTLLLILGDEVFSVGECLLGDATMTLSCLRGRRGSHAAAHGAGVEAWLVFRDELAAFTHATFAAGQTRSFKLQPFNQRALALDEAAPLPHTFRDRAAEAPQIAFGPVPARLVEGATAAFSAQIADVNGDLVSWSLRAEQLDPADDTVIASLHIAAGTPAPAERASLAVSATAALPRAGTWRLVIEATDEADAHTQAATDLFAVAARDDGGWGDPLPGPPPVPSGLVIQGGLEQLGIYWAQEEVNTVATWELCIKDAAGLVAEVTHAGLAGTSLVLSVPPGTTRYARVRAVGKNSLVSGWSGEVAGTSMTIGADAIGAYGAAITQLQERQSGLVRDHKNLLLAQGGMHAAVQVFAENFLNELGQLIARYGVTLDVNGWVTGFEQSNGGPGSDYFDILASQFRIRHPSAPAAIPFFVENGIIYMNTAVIKELSASKLSGGSTNNAAIILASGSSIKSEGFADGQRGFILRSDGTAELDRVTVRDTLMVGTLGGVSISPVVANFLENQSVSVSLSMPAGVTLRYTLDGQEVTPSSAIWPSGSSGLNPMLIEGTCLLRVRGFNDQGQMTEETRGIYIKEAQQSSMVVLSSSRESSNQWRDIYVFAACATPGSTVYLRIVGHIPSDLGGYAAIYSSSGVRTSLGSGQKNTDWLEVHPNGPNNGCSLYITAKTGGNITVHAKSTASGMQESVVTSQQITW